MPRNLLIGTILFLLTFLDLANAVPNCNNLGLLYKLMGASSVNPVDVYIKLEPSRIGDYAWDMAPALMGFGFTTFVSGERPNQIWVTVKSQVQAEFLLRYIGSRYQHLLVEMR